jgi:hypothetical protein
MTAIPSRRRVGLAMRAWREIKNARDIVDGSTLALAFFFFYGVGLRFAVCESCSAFLCRVRKSCPRLAQAGSW